MSEHPNAGVARGLWSAIAEGDPRRVAVFLDRDVVWNAPGRHPLAGQFRGADAVCEHLARAADLSEEFRSTFRAVMCDDESAMIIHKVSARRGGKKLDLEFFLLLRIVSGRVVSVQSVPFDQHLVDAFWS